MSSVWDNPKLTTNDDFIKFENVGDKVVGTILDIGIRTWDDGKVDPQLLIQEDGADLPRTLTAGQTKLRAKLSELRPNVGDRIAIVFTQIEKRGGGKTLKHFDVTVAPVDAAPAAAATTTTTPPPETPAPPAAGISAASLL